MKYNSALIAATMILSNPYKAEVNPTPYVSLSSKLSPSSGRWHTYTARLVSYRGNQRRTITLKERSKKRALKKARRIAKQYRSPPFRVLSVH